MGKSFGNSIKWDGFFWIGVFAALFGFCSPRVSLAQTSAEIHGRACLMVEDANSESSPFDNASKLGLDKRLSLYAEADADCTLLVAAFDEKDRSVANGWMPQLVEMKAWEEKHLPSPSVAWSCGADPQDFEMFVVFADPQAQGFERLRQLVGRMQQETHGKLLEAQGRKLREELMRWIGSGDSGIFHAGRSAAAWGGTLRASRPPWRASAQSVVFHPGDRAVLMYKYGQQK